MGKKRYKDKREYTHEDWVWERFKDRLIIGAIGLGIVLIVKLFGGF